MLTIAYIQYIIQKCRAIGKSGLGNGVKAQIQPLNIQVVSPPYDFLGVHGNPAIFVNEHTYKLLGWLHPNWIPNATIALKKSLLTNNPIEGIGAIVHEVGHAFNVAADIANNEANAYVFEIEAMLKLYRTRQLPADCSMADMKSFFKSRLPFYRKETHNHPHLSHLVQIIHQQFIAKENVLPEKKSHAALLSETSLFKQKVWKKEYALISQYWAVQLEI